MDFKIVRRPTATQLRTRTKPTNNNMASIENGKVKLTDEKGGSSYASVTDLKGSNDVIHVIDSVVLPG